MFEKEAEDNKPPYAFCALDTKCELWKDGFQKGAKFGYNKAKEEMQENGLALQSDMDKAIEQNITLKKQIEKMKCCGNCQKLRGRFDHNTHINILYCSDSDMKQIEVGFQMCCCKWKRK